jgi:fatty acid-binding protein 3
MVDALVGEWKLIDSQNFEELMKQLGVNFLLRKVGNTTKPNVNFKVEGDEWTFTTTSAIKSATIKFKLNQEIDEETMDGRKVKVILNTCKKKLILYLI